MKKITWDWKYELPRFLIFLLGMIIGYLPRFLIFLLGMIIGYFIFPNSKESPHRWIGYFKERYVNTHNIVMTRYNYSFIVPKEVGLTQKGIMILADSNSFIIDDTRMIGTILEFKEADK